MNELKEISKSAVQRAVLQKAAQQPVTIYPAVLATLGGMSAVVFGLDVITVGAIVAGATIALSGFVGKFFTNKDEYANQYMSAIRLQLVEKRKAILNGLEEDLGEVSELTGIKQISLFREKYENLLGILDKKLEPNELTYMRYLTIAEQVFLGGLDNLQNVALALKSVSAIDINNIEQQLLVTKKSKDTTLAGTLKKRKRLFEQQHARANELLSQNEAALTQLDHVTTKLANIKTIQGHAVMDIDDAMLELGSLINRADKYTIKKSN